MLQGIPSLMAARGIGNTLLNGLTVYYALSDTSDATTGGLTLTNHNTVTFSAGKIGNAANFVAASSQYLSRADGSAFQMGTSDFSFSAWVNFTSSASNLTPIGYGDANAGYKIDINSTGLRIEIAQVGLNLFTSAVHSFNDGSWHLVIGTFDRSSGATISCYIDNSLENSQSSAILTGSVNSSFGFQVGAENATHFMDGSVDEVGLWNRLLTSAERTSLWNSGSGKTYPF